MPALKIMLSVRAAARAGEPAQPAALHQMDQHRSTTRPQNAAVCSHIPQHYLMHSAPKASCCCTCRLAGAQHKAGLCASAGLAQAGHACMQPEARQALTIDGTTPSMVTPAACTNSPKGRPRGEPCRHRAGVSPSPGHSRCESSDLHALRPMDHRPCVPQSCPCMCREVTYPCTCCTLCNNTPSSCTSTRLVSSQGGSSCCAAVAPGLTSKTAMVAPFSRAAKSSQGPIIQPRLLGQASTSPGRTSCRVCASRPARRGVLCVHGIALGSPAQAWSHQGCKALAHDTLGSVERGRQADVA